MAVVSLPGGVFNPYSGVKTSILLLDKALARRTDRIAFFKVANDGFDLGAQRSPIEKNDLPQVQDEIDIYMQGLRADETAGDSQSAQTALAAESRAEYVTEGSRATNGLIVKKERVAEGGEYNLSGERYRINPDVNHSFPMVALGDNTLFRVESGGTPKSTVEEYWNGGIAWATLVDLPAENLVSEIRSTQRTISATGLTKSSATLLPENSVIVSTRATIGRIGINRIPMATNQGFKNIVIRDSTRAIPEYVALAVTRLVPTMDTWASGGTFKEISKTLFCQLQIPLPPLEVQKEIVAEIEGYQKVIDGARAVVENYRPHIHVDPDWPMVELGDLVENVLIGLVRSKADQNPTFPYKYLKMNNITRKGALELEEISYVNATPEELKRYALRDGDYLYNTRNSPDLVGKSAVFHGKSDSFVFNNNILRMRFCPVTIPDFVNLVMNSEFGKAKIRALVDGTTSVAALYQKNYLAIEIPLPTLQTQRAVVAEIEAEQALVSANRDLIKRLEGRVQATIERVWT